MIKRILCYTQTASPQEKGEARSLHIRLGNQNTSISLQQQISTNPILPKVHKPKDLIHY